MIHKPHMYNNLDATRGQRELGMEGRMVLLGCCKLYSLPWILYMLSTGGSLSMARGKKTEPSAALVDADANLGEWLKTYGKTRRAVPSSLPLFSHFWR